MPQKPPVTLYGLTKEQLQQMGTYLMGKPYSEVEQLVSILKSAPTLQVTFTEPDGPVDFPPIGEDSAPEANKSVEA